MFTNKVIAITGGTGSFGTHVVKLFLSTDVREIRIFSRDEKKQEEMRIAMNNSRLKFYIGDVRDYGSISQALRGADYVYHAAALKQVTRVCMAAWSMEKPFTAPPICPDWSLRLT